ncbi:MAG TPA: ribosome small subunit-dependent GTPase A [Vicinamibacteria bacterium]|nr:ribosome small subunit-dependent GTPase A [Vicinamibacteria bacterium]
MDDIGWDEAWAAQFVEHAAMGLVPARVAVGHRGQCVLSTDGGERSARVAGRLRRQGEDVAVGDWVAAAPGSGDWRVDAVLPRRTLLVRREAGTRERPQVLAANVDVVFVVAGLDGDFNPRRVERTLVAVADSGARAVVLLNKADACDEVGPRSEQMRRAAGEAPLHVISALRGDGVDEVRAHIGRGTTVVLLGSSGAGKSTLANRLLGRERQATAAVREDDSRGRHTTTRRELMVLPGGGVLIDTPGLRELQLWAGGAAAGAAFDDVESLAASCRFADCGHAAEPGCAVLAAVAGGTLDGARLLSYRKLRAELRHAERQVDAEARRLQERRWRTIHKAARRHRPRW